MVLSMVWLVREMLRVRLWKCWFGLCERCWAWRNVKYFIENSSVKHFTHFCLRFYIWLKKDIFDQPFYSITNMIKCVNYFTTKKRRRINSTNQLLKQQVKKKMAKYPHYQPLKTTLHWQTVTTDNSFRPHCYCKWQQSLTHQLLSS